MNWFYPNFLKRIDHYLKINYPHVWRTRVHDFGWFSLILGNVAAAILGTLIVGHSNVMHEGNIMVMHFSFATFLGFVSLFWIVRLMRFKLKFSDFKMLLTTWLIYVFCVVSLVVNLMTFTFSTAHQTANLYSNKVLKSHHDYLKIVDGFYFKKTSYTESECQNTGYSYEDGFLKIQYGQTLTKIVSLHNPHYNDKGKVCEADIREAIDRIELIQQAKAFAARPFRGEDINTFYHQLFRESWLSVILMLFFLPALLFLVSVFGVKDTLISAFVAAAIAVLVPLGVRFFYAGYHAPEYVSITFVIIVFVLKIMLLSNKNRLWYQNYIAGTLILMLGVLSFSAFLVIFFHDDGCITTSPNYLLILLIMLPLSLSMSFMGAWLIGKQNDQPVLR